MDRGTMTDEEAVRSICKRIPQSEWELVERFVREFRMKQEPNPPMEALLGELKEQGYHLFLMSNTSHRFRAFSKNIPSVGYHSGTLFFHIFFRDRQKVDLHGIAAAANPGKNRFL